jgi:pimeloyl-ACP methyl ester carboxylesterase
MKTVRSKDGTTIAYDQAGQGPPVILVDGALCGRKFGPMPKLVPLLAKRFTVIHYDRRGRGDSSDTSPYAVEREVEDLAALIGEAGGSAFVHGTSSGAALALAAAASGLNIRKLALYEPPFIGNGNGGHQPPVDHRAHLARLISDGRRSEAVKYFMTKMVGSPAIFALIMPLLPVWKKLKAVAHTLPYDAAVLGDFTVPVQRASRVSTPTLVMDGGKSPAPLRNAVAAVAKAVPNAQQRTLERQTHMVKPEVLAPVLEEFFVCN